MSIFINNKKLKSLFLGGKSTQKAILGEEAMFSKEFRSPNPMFLALSSDKALAIDVSSDDTVDIRAYDHTFAGSGKTINSVCYGYAAVSKDGQSLPKKRGMYVAFCSGDIHVALESNSQSAYYSSDGLNWTATPLGFSDAQWRGLVRSADKFVAQSEANNRISWSSDGITWNPVTIPGSVETWKGIAYGNGAYVMISTTGKIAYSTDAITWTVTAPTTIVSTANWCYPVYGNGMFVAFGYYYEASDGSWQCKIAYSTDGMAWSELKSDELNDIQGTNTPSSFWSQPTLVYGNGVFLACNSSSTFGISYNGTEWSSFTLPSSLTSFAYPPVYISFSGGRFIAVSMGQYAAYSSDGVNWSQFDLGGIGNWTTANYYNGKYVVASSDYKFSVTDGGASPLYSMNFDYIGFSWSAIASGSSQDGSSVIISNTGAMWGNPIFLPESLSWSEVCYGEGCFVAVAVGTNRCYISNDLNTWNVKSLGTLEMEWTSVCYGFYNYKGRFVAIADGSRAVAVSTDYGVTWSVVTGLPTEAAWTSVRYGNGVFLAVTRDNSGICAVSVDGVNWTQKSQPTGGSRTYNKNMVFGGEYFAIFPSDYSSLSKYYITTNGDSWQEMTSGVSYSTVVGGCMDFFGSGLTLAMHSTAGVNTAIWTSEGGRYSKDLQGFTSLGGVPSTVLGESIGLTAATMGFKEPSQLILPIQSSSGMYFLAETLFEPYSPYSFGMDVANLQSIAYGNGVYVGVFSTGNQCLTSRDGINWTARTLPASLSLQNIAYGNGLFVAVSASGNQCLTSPNGITWTARTLPASLSLHSIAYGNGLFVAVSASGNQCLTSPNGITWTARTLPASGNHYAVTYGNHKFVIFTYGSDKLDYSSDGVNWTNISLPTSSGWADCVYARDKGLFVAVGGYGPSLASDKALSSTDGINWTQRQLPLVRGWRTVTYVNGYFWAFNVDSPEYAWSSDGTNWNQGAIDGDQYYLSSMRRLPIY